MKKSLLYQLNLKDARAEEAKRLEAKTVAPAAPSTFFVFIALEFRVE